MLLHYSISFENAPLKHHGEIVYPLNVYQNTEPYIESMIAFVKADLAKSIKRWGFSSGDMIKADFYFYKNGEEIIFFEWEKEDDTKHESPSTQ